MEHKTESALLLCEAPYTYWGQTCGHVFPTGYRARKNHWMSEIIITGKKFLDRNKRTLHASMSNSALLSSQLPRLSMNAADSNFHPVVGGPESCFLAKVEQQLTGLIEKILNIRK